MVDSEGNKINIGDEVIIYRAGYVSRDIVTKIRETGGYWHEGSISVKKRGAIIKGKFIKAKKDNREKV